MATHELKADPNPFMDVYEGRKWAEVRRNDRGYEVGDVLHLRETKYTYVDMEDGAPLEYTGRECYRLVSHIQHGYGLPHGLCVLSLRELESASQPGGDELSTIDQVMADCEAFEAAMVEAGYNRPDLGKYPGMYRYQRDQDRYMGWKLARAAPSAGNGEAKGEKQE